MDVSGDASVAANRREEGLFFDKLGTRLSMAEYLLLSQQHDEIYAVYRVREILSISASLHHWYETQDVSSDYRGSSNKADDVHCFQRGYVCESRKGHVVTESRPSTASIVVVCL